MIFQIFEKAYVLSNDKEFAAATIHAIGRCASSIKEVADNCLTGLVNLMSKKDGKAFSKIKIFFCVSIDLNFLFYLSE